VGGRLLVPGRWAYLTHPFFARAELNEKVLEALRASEADGMDALVEVALALLYSPFAPPGIAFAGGVIPLCKPFDAWMLSERLHVARNTVFYFACMPVAGKLST